MLDDVLDRLESCIIEKKSLLVAVEVMSQHGMIPLTPAGKTGNGIQDKSSVEAEGSPHPTNK